jgi:hypothetical protein
MTPSRHRILFKVILRTYLTVYNGDERRLCIFHRPLVMSLVPCVSGPAEAGRASEQREEEVTWSPQPSRMGFKHRDRLGLDGCVTAVITHACPFSYPSNGAGPIDSTTLTESNAESGPGLSADRSALVSALAARACRGELWGQWGSHWCWRDGGYDVGRAVRSGSIRGPTFKLWLRYLDEDLACCTDALLYPMYTPLYPIL